MTLQPLVADWPADAVEDYMERAAIVEFCGRRNRLDAERLAEKIVREKYAAHGAPAVTNEGSSHGY